MKKNVVIIILVTLVLSLGGYLVYDKVIDKDVKEEAKEETKNNQDTSQSKNQDYVGVAFSETLTIDWPTEELGKYDSDPDTVTKKAEIPKILIDTDVAKIINDKIYNDYEFYIKMFDNGYVFKTNEKIEELNIIYDYKVYEDILFIIVKTFNNLHRGGSSVSYMAYYYDIKNDKVLTVDDICNKYNIDLKFSYDESADKIYAVMPTYLGNFDVYYTQDSTCPSIGCTGMYTSIK